MLRFAHGRQPFDCCVGLKRAREIARILCGAGYAVVPFRPPRKIEGMEHRVAHQSSVLPHPLLKDAGASRRSIAAFLSPGPRFLVYGPVRRASTSPPCGQATFRRTDNHWPIPSPASSSRSDRSVTRSGPEASRVRGYVRPRPRAPHPCSTITTPHESALDEPDGYNPSYVGINVKGPAQNFSAVIAGLEMRVGRSFMPLDGPRRSRRRAPGHSDCGRLPWRRTAPCRPP